MAPQTRKRYTIEKFGVDRVMFASNFPMDKTSMFGALVFEQNFALEAAIYLDHTPPRLK
jgi:predicted TIM-barrel fold metal-dependent hydrolase